MKTLAAIIASIVPHLIAQPAGTPLPPGRFDLTSNGTTVTVRANEASVPELLEDFSNKSGIAFNKYLGKIEKTTLDLQDVKVEEFLNRVLGSYIAKSRKKDGVAAISSVTIMDEGKEGSSPPSRAPARKEAPTPRPVSPRADGKEPVSARERRLRSFRKRPPQSVSAPPKLPAEHPPSEGEAETP